MPHLLQCPRRARGASTARKQSARDFCSVRRPSRPGVGGCPPGTASTMADGAFRSCCSGPQRADPAGGDRCAAAIDKPARRFPALCSTRIRSDGGSAGLRNPDTPIENVPVARERACADFSGLRCGRVCRLLHARPCSWASSMVAGSTLVVRIFRGSVVFRSAPVYGLSGEWICSGRTPSPRIWAGQRRNAAFPFSTFNIHGTLNSASPPEIAGFNMRL